LSLRKWGKLPKNHTERFEILKQRYHAIYHELDKMFPVYRKSYRDEILKEELEQVEHGFAAILAECEKKIGKILAA